MTRSVNRTLAHGCQVASCSVCPFQWIKNSRDFRFFGSPVWAKTRSTSHAYNTEQKQNTNTILKIRQTSTIRQTAILHVPAQSIPRAAEFPINMLTPPPPSSSWGLASSIYTIFNCDWAIASELSTTATNQKTNRANHSKKQVRNDICSATLLDTTIWVEWKHDYHLGLDLDEPHSCPLHLPQCWDQYPMHQHYLCLSQHPLHPALQQSLSP